MYIYMYYRGGSVSKLENKWLVEWKNRKKYSCCRQEHVCLHADTLACMQTHWRDWRQMVSETKQTKKKYLRGGHVGRADVTRDALAWLGTHLLPCGHADVARNAPASLQTCWHGRGHVCLHMNALACEQTCGRVCLPMDALACERTCWRGQDMIACLQTH